MNVYLLLNSSLFQCRSYECANPESRVIRMFTFAPWTLAVCSVDTGPLKLDVRVCVHPGNCSGTRKTRIVISCSANRRGAARGGFWALHAGTMAGNLSRMSATTRNQGLLTATAIGKNISTLTYFRFGLAAALPALVEYVRAAWNNDAVFVRGPAADRNGTRAATDSPRIPMAACMLCWSPPPRRLPHERATKDNISLYPSFKAREKQNDAAPRHKQLAICVADQEFCYM